MNLATRIPSRIIPFAIAAAIMLTIVAIATGAVSAQDNRPDAPANLTATGGDDAGTITVSWDEHSETVKDYRLAWAKADGNFRPHSNSQWNAYPTGNSHTITGLDAGVEYKIKVRARFDGSKSSHWTQVARATATEADPPPAQVTNVDTNEKTDQTAVTVSWTAATGATGYQVERIHQPRQDDDPTTWTLGVVTSHDDTTTAYNTEYLYRVRAKNDSGYGDWSLWSDITTAREPGTPDRPTRLAAAEDTAGTVSITWTAPSGDEEVKGYRLYREDQSDLTTANIADPGANDTSYDDDTVAAETAYRYWIVAWNDTGDGPKSNRDTITTKVQTAGVPEAPSRPTATEETRGEVVISWNAPSSGPTPEQYNVYRKPIANVDYDLIATVSTTTHTDDTVAEETWYEYRVRGTNDAGEGTASRFRTIRTRVQTPGVPEYPTGLTLTEDSDGNVTVSWSAPEDGPAPTRYRVTRTGFTSADDEVTNEVTTTSFTDSTVDPDTLYAYRVRAINDAGDGDETNDKYIQTAAE